MSVMTMIQYHNDQTITACDELKELGIKIMEGRGQSFGTEKPGDVLLESIAITMIEYHNNNTITAHDEPKWKISPHL